jgi:hypothetical protein
MIFGIGMRLIRNDGKAQQIMAAIDSPNLGRIQRTPKNSLKVYLKNPEKS